MKKMIEEGVNFLFEMCESLICWRSAEGLTEEDFTSYSIERLTPVVGGSVADFDSEYLFGGFGVEPIEICGGVFDHFRVDVGAVEREPSE